MTRATRPILGALAVLTAATALAALAAQNRAASEFILRRFDELDANRDGRVTRAEAGNASWFNSLDANRDGELTRAEAGGATSKLNAAAGNPRSLNGLSGERLFEAMDRNGDGKLDAAELPRRGMLEQLDRDGDGLVTQAEAVESMRNLGREQTLVPKKLASGAPAEPESPREGPRILNASERGVGRLVPDAAFTDIAGRASSLSKTAADKPLVIALTGTSCPLNKKFGPTLARLEDEYAAKGVRFLFVAPTETDSPNDLRAAAKELGLDGPYVRDDGKTLIAALNAETTTEVFVLDAARTLIYRGAVNDQYGLAYTLDAPRFEPLRSALDAVLAGRRPEIAATTSPGCALDAQRSDSPVAANDNLTYHNRISRILLDNCVECHRSGGVGPFSLETFADVNAHAAMMRRQVGRGLMPPWFAAAKADAAHSPWINDRSLGAEDRDALLAWLEGPRPEGNPKDAPLPRVFPEGWQIGEPDLVVQLPRAVPIKADGFMPYHNVTVETTLTEDRWVSAFEVRPGVREAVHHVLIFVRPPAGAEEGEFDGEGSERRGFFAAYVPGNGHRIYPAGFANKLPAGSRLHFQIHYTPFGKAVTDRTQLGLKFSDTPPRHEVQVTGIANIRIQIPPGEADHVETAKLRVPADVYASAFTPHMHVRGKAFKYEVEYPDGRREVLLDIPRYDFNWQLSYTLKEPVRIPAGSVITTTAIFDNSTGNPANPDPARTVRWGQQTVDEMMLGYLEFHTASDVTLGRGRGARGRDGAE